MPRVHKVILHTAEPASGAARYVAELFSALQESSFRVVLFCPNNMQYASGFHTSGAGVAFSGCRSVDSTGSILDRLLRNLRYLAGACRRQCSVAESGDIIHFQFPLHFPFGLVQFALARISGCAIVFTAHDAVPHKWLLPKPLRALEAGSLRVAYRLSNRIVVHNAAAAELIQTRFGVPAEKTRVIPHGPFVVEHSQRRVTPSSLLELLCFGSLRENKGLLPAIQAVQRINTGGVRVRLTIAGAVANAKEQAYWNRCKQELALAGTSVSVIERFIPDEEIGVFLSHCDAVLLPYTDFTSDSGVAAMALANSRPIIASHTGGLAALLDLGELGIGIESASATSVQAAIERALQLGPAALREMGERGARVITQDRSWTLIADKTATVYTDVWKQAGVRSL